jgi:hypothetical protein
MVVIFPLMGFTPRTPDVNDVGAKDLIINT